MLSLLNLWIRRYNAADLKPSRGWCNDDSFREQDRDGFLQRREKYQFETSDNIKSIQSEEASENDIDIEIEKTENDISGDTILKQFKCNIGKSDNNNDNLEHEMENIDTQTTSVQEQDDLNISPPESCQESIPSVSSMTELRIFVATWNMAAKDPFASRTRGPYIGDDHAAKAVKELIPLGYDLYVIGTQEKVTTYLDAAILARLQHSRKDNQNVVTRQLYHRLDLTAKETRPYRQMCQCQSLIHCETRIHRSSYCGSDRTCGLCSPKSWYIDSDDTPIVNSTVHCLCWPKEISACEIRGHGDHALIHRKSTSLSIYYAHYLENHLHVIATGSHKFLGSKGGIAVTIRLSDDPQTLTFVNCHLEANSIERRLRQLEQLATELPRSLARGTTKFEFDTLATWSDHVVWMGDFNSRLQLLESNQVLKLLTAGRLQELHDKYDSLATDLKNVPGLQSFREPVKWPTFFPTYKKVPYRARLPLSGSTTGTGRTTRWVQHVYKTKYREPIYKGGRIRERVPSWCDRILYHSQNSEYFKVEKVTCFDSNNNQLTLQRDNYRALNDELRGSDHSPVSCTFLWSVHQKLSGYQDTDVPL
ncbi:putative endonuclease/exonuclease/phosphatase [Plasmopara halstedii]